MQRVLGHYSHTIHLIVTKTNRWWKSYEKKSVQTKEYATETIKCHKTNYYRKKNKKKKNKKNIKFVAYAKKNSMGCLMTMKVVEGFVITAITQTQGHCT